MGGSWTFGQKLGFGYALAALTLLMVAVVGYRTTRHLVENDRWVEHTHLVRERISSLLARMLEAESAARAYAIIGDESIVPEHERAFTDSNAIFAELRSLMSDNANQQRRLDTLRPELEGMAAFQKRYIEQRRRAGLEGAAAIVSGGDGRRYMAAMRHVLDEMSHEEQRLLVTRSADATASAEIAHTTIFWGSALGTLFVALIGWFIARSLTRQIALTARQIQSSSAELQSAANQQVTSAKEQSTAMNEITTTISELLATAKQIAESARRVSGVATDTVSSARDGDQLVLRSSEAISVIQRQVDLIVSHMLDLGRKSQQIGGILELINELAEQTNILAINATIEAAGAGESGKRFAVVAEEIRRLADRVGVSTKEIRQLIEDIRAAVNKTVMTTEGGNKAVETGVRLFAEVATSFTQIASLVGTTTEAAREIELSTKQQSTAVEQVNVAAANVAQASRETESSSSQTLQTAAQLATLSRELLKIVQAQVGS